MGKTTRHDLLAAALQALALAAAFGLGYAARAVRGRADPQPPAAAARGAFIDELQALHAAHARRLELLRDDPRARDEANAQHRFEVAAAYRRHGKAPPPGLPD